MGCEPFIGCTRAFRHRAKIHDARDEQGRSRNRRRRRQPGRAAQRDEWRGKQAEQRGPLVVEEQLHVIKQLLAVGFLSACALGVAFVQHRQPSLPQAAHAIWIEAEARVKGDDDARADRCDFCHDAQARAGIDGERFIRIRRRRVLVVGGEEKRGGIHPRAVRVDAHILQPHDAHRHRSGDAMQEIRFLCEHHSREAEAKRPQIVCGRGRGG